MCAPSRYGSPFPGNLLGGWHGGQRELDCDEQAVGRVLRADGASVQLGRALGNGEPQAYAAAGALARLAHAIERLKNVLQLRFGNAGAVIAYGEDRSLHPPL